MTDKQPEALHLADIADDGAWTFVIGVRKEIAAALLRQHAELETLRAKLKVYEDLGDAGSDVQLLRMGYAAARLEIESLRGQQNKDTPGQTPPHTGKCPQSSATKSATTRMNGASAPVPPAASRTHRVHGCATQTTLPHLLQGRPQQRRQWCKTTSLRFASPPRVQKCFGY